MNEVQNLTERIIRKLRCDDGKEYMDANVQKFAREKDISIKPYLVYVHELNGTPNYTPTLVILRRLMR